MTTYYISPAGNDSSGTGAVSSPWATFAKALTVVAAGDTVIARGGTYRESVNFTVNGTPAAPIRWVRYSGETPVVTGMSLLTGWTRVGASDLFQKTLASAPAEVQYVREDGRVFYQKVTNLADLVGSGQFHYNTSSNVLTIRTSNAATPNQRVIEACTAATVLDIDSTNQIIDGIHVEFSNDQLVNVASSASYLTFQNSRLRYSYNEAIELATSVSSTLTGITAIQCAQSGLGNVVEIAGTLQSLTRVVLANCGLASQTGRYGFNVTAGSVTLSECAVNSSDLSGVGMVDDTGSLLDSLEIASCTFQSLTGFGIYLQGNVDATSVLIHHNTIRTCALSGIQFAAWSPPETRVYRNIVAFCATDATQAASGVQFSDIGGLAQAIGPGPQFIGGATGPFAGISVRSEVSSSDAIKIWNNTFYRNGSYGSGGAVVNVCGLDATRFDVAGTSNEFVNNIVYGTDALVPLMALSTSGSTAFTTCDYNCYYNTQTDLTLLFGTGPSDLVTHQGATTKDTYSIAFEPYFRDATNADFELLSDSPAIDSGFDVGFSYIGSGPDMGALESPFEPDLLIDDLVAEQTAEGPGVRLTWSVPDLSRVGAVKILRKLGSWPESITDGVEVYSGLADSELFDFEVSAGRWYHYTAFTRSNLTGEWLFSRVNSSAEVWTHESGFWERYLWTHVPEVYRTEDRASSQTRKLSPETLTSGDLRNRFELVSPAGVTIPHETKGPLRRLFKLFGLEADRYESWILALETLQDPLRCPARYLPWLASLIGLSLNTELPSSRWRAELLNAFAAYKARSTDPGLDLAISVTTGATVGVKSYTPQVLYLGPVGGQGTLWDPTNTTRMNSLEDTHAVLIDLSRVDGTGHRTAGGFLVEVDTGSGDADTGFSAVFASKVAKLANEHRPVGYVYGIRVTATIRDSVGPPLDASAEIARTSSPYAPFTLISNNLSFTEAEPAP